MQNQPNPKQLTIFQAMPNKANNDNSIEHKYYNGELWIRIGFKEYPATKCPDIICDVEQPEQRMDLTRNDKPVKPASPGFKTQSLPKFRRGGEGW